MSKLELDVNQNTSCGYHRIHLPFRYLQVDPKVPVYMFNRAPSGGVNTLRKKREKGYKVIADIDDYWVLPKSHYLHDVFASGYGNQIAESLKLADVVTTTNAVLADRVRVLNKNVVIVPNALPFDQGQFVAASRHGQSRYVYAAGASHYDDIYALQSALSAPDLTIAGYDPAHDQWKRIQACVPNARLSHERKIGDYMRVYDGHAVAIAPLVDNEFNRCKSNLKILEAGAKRMPIIASPVHPYFNDLDRQYVIYAGDADDWRRKMTRINVSQGYADEMGHKLGEHVRKHYQLSAANEIRRQIIMGFA